MDVVDLSFVCDGVFAVDYDLMNSDYFIFEECYDWNYSVIYVYLLFVN